jgi:hypothetical protein
MNYKYEQVIIELPYFPPLEFFCLLMQSENIILEVSEHYLKQTYRNRCQILTSHGIRSLIIPVKEGNSKIPVRDIRIDFRQKWVQNHWRTIRTAYGKAPFFDYYADYFNGIYSNPPKFLIEFNWEILSLCLNLLKFKPVFSFSINYRKNLPDKILDVRTTIHPKKHYELNNFYTPKSYYQVFGRKFVANLSILDLILCEGPNSIDILTSSISRDTNKADK